MLPVLGPAFVLGVSSHTIELPAHRQVQNFTWRAHLCRTRGWAGFSSCVHLEQILQARRTAVSSRATSRGRGRSLGSKEIAATRGGPPPPNFSASDARFLSAVA